MGSTTSKGYPFPVGTDRVMDGDDAIKALAEAVDMDSRYTRATTKGQSVALNVQADIVWNAPSPNEAGLTVSSTVMFTFTVPGIYVISATFIASAFASISARAYFILSVGPNAATGGVPDSNRAAWSGENTVTCTTVRRCIAGDVIKAAVLGNDEAFSVGANTGWLNVARLAR